MKTSVRLMAVLLMAVLLLPALASCRTPADTTTTKPIADQLASMT